jgi:hypothetical protein
MKDRVDKSMGIVTVELGMSYHTKYTAHSSSLKTYESHTQFYTPPLVYSGIVHCQTVTYQEESHTTNPTSYMRSKH